MLLLLFSIENVFNEKENYSERDIFDRIIIVVRSIIQK